MKKKWLTALIIYAGLVAICIVAIYVIPSVQGFLEQTYVAEYGSVEIADAIEGYIVRDETVYAASNAGTIERIQKEGELVTSGARVVELEADDSDRENRKYSSIMSSLGDSIKYTKGGYTKTAGFVSYYVDGAESKITTETMGDLTRDDYKSLSSVKMTETASDNCAEGDPVFKIVKNGKWYLVFYLDNTDADKYYEGKSVTLEAGDEDVPMTVASVDKGKKTTKVTLSCKTYFDGFFETRKMETNLVFASAEGLLLEDTSVVEKDGQTGVIVKNNLGEHVFTPVSIKADNGEQCVVYSDIYVDDGGNFVETISTYDEILTEPTDEDIKDAE